MPEDELTVPLSTPTDIPIAGSPNATATPKPTSASAQQISTPFSLKEDEIGRLTIEGKKIAIKRAAAVGGAGENVGRIYARQLLSCLYRSILWLINKSLLSNLV